MHRAKTPRAAVAPGRRVSATPSARMFATSRRISCIFSLHVRRAREIRSARTRAHARGWLTEARARAQTPGLWLDRTILRFSLSRACFPPKRAENARPLAALRKSVKSVSGGVSFRGVSGGDAHRVALLSHEPSISSRSADPKCSRQSEIGFRPRNTVICHCHFRRFARKTLKNRFDEEATI